MATALAAAGRQVRRARPAMPPTTAKQRGCRLDLQPSSTRRAGTISAPKWSREFDDPIALPDGRKPVTLEPGRKLELPLSWFL
jgi:hypothetical protein